jgi:hypothetical protein
MVQDDQDAPRYQHGSNWGGEATAPRQVLLDRHDRAEEEHPPDVPRPHGEHQEHERPATADAEQSMMQPEPQRLEPPTPVLPVLDDEAQRRATLVEAAVLEG